MFSFFPVSTLVLSAAEDPHFGLFFETFDTNGDSKLSLAELARSISSTEESFFQQVFQESDINGDGMIDKSEAEEFGVAMDRQAGLVHDAAEDPDLGLFFETFDTNGDSKLSLAELARSISSTEEFFFQQVFQESDINGDGMIDMSEAQEFGVAMDRQHDAPDPELKVFFDVLDANQDSRVSLAELSDSGPSTEKSLLRDVFADSDGDKDGMLDMMEMLVLTTTMDRYTKGNSMFERVFNVFDVNGDSRLSLAELSADVLPAEKQYFLEAFERADINDDGKLDRVETLDLSARMDEMDQRLSFAELTEHMDSQDSESAERDPRVELFVESFDVDGDSMLSLSELLHVVTPEEEELFRRAFKEADVNSDSMLDVSEVPSLSDAMDRATLGYDESDDQEFKHAFAEYDANKDGKVSFAELMAEVPASAIGPFRKVFHVSDSDGDGELDWDEARAFSVALDTM